MNFINNDNRLLLVLPALLSFIISLLLLYKFSFPISWDVYYHVHMIDLYSQYGLVFWDFATVAPRGRLIMYPPMFHIILASLSNFFKVSPMDLCRYLQPFFSFYLVGVITYVSYKITDVECSLITAFLSMFCFVTFNRSVICTPATIAMGLFLLSCYFIYASLNNKKYLFASGIALALIWNLHMATAILATGTIALYVFIQFLRAKFSLKDIFSYLLIMALFAAPWWLYIFLNYGFTFNSLAGSNSFITDFFFRYYGIVPSLLLIAGYYHLVKDWSEKSLFLVLVTLPLVLLSQVYLLGFNTVSVRILEVSSYSLILVSGIGLYFIFEKYIKESYKNIILVVIVLLSVSSALLYVDSYTPDLVDDNDSDTTLIDRNIHMLINPVTTIYKPTIISSRFGDSSLAHDRQGIAEFFVGENSSSLAVSEDQILDTILVSTSRTPVVYGGFTESIPDYVTDPVHIIRGWSNGDELHSLNVGYLIIKNDTQVPYYCDVVYSNSNYKVCKVKDEYR